MVDAAMSFRSQTSLNEVPASSPLPVSTTTPAGMAAYRDLAANGMHGPAQAPLWIEQWVASTQADCSVVAVEEAGKPALALALEVVRSGPFRVARFMGGSHANGNFPVADPSFLRSGMFSAEALLAAVRTMRPDVDALVLSRQLPELDGTPNPLLALPHFQSPNIALAADLTGGFEGLLSRVSGKRKRKKHRWAMRKFEAAGGLRRIEAQTPDEVSRLLDAYFAMKESRFRKMGIADVFGEAEVRNFFRALFSSALESTPHPFVLHALEVGGKLRAVTGTSVSGKRMICEFAGIADDELAHASPGDYLFFENIEQACCDGFAVYDFSVGDEPYKRLWCELETRQFDVVAPLTVKGQLLAQRLRLEARVKAYVKNNPTIWRLTKMLRKNAAGQDRQPAEED
jgi:CelD/BcsL family acetyltransferase involved in cellulose biosynthesis